MSQSLCRPCAKALYASRLQVFLQRRQPRNNLAKTISQDHPKARLYHATPSAHITTRIEPSPSSALHRPTETPLATPNRTQRRSYYSAEHTTPPPYPPAETAILSASLPHVPQHGFTTAALTLGTTDAGYLPASLNLLPHGGPYDLLLYHLITTRLALRDTVQFPEAKTNLSVRDKTKTLILARLRANNPYITHLAAGLALLTQPSKLPTSLHELGLLADEIVYLSGDIAVDTSWYTRRAGVAGIYAAAEVFMCQDQSDGFKETEGFVERRMEEAAAVEGTVGSVGEWVGYSAWSAVNVARSWGVRI